MRVKVTRQCPKTTIFEEKGEPKRIRTEVLLFTCLTAKPNRIAYQGNPLCVLRARSSWRSCWLQWRRISHRIVLVWMKINKALWEARYASLGPVWETCGEEKNLHDWHAEWQLKCHCKHGASSPFLTGRMFVRRTYFGQFDELYFVHNWLVMRCKLRPELAADAQQTAWLKM